MIYYNNTELYHHGIKGQKWGLRRYQNKDGSLTAAGEKRYSIDYDKKGNAFIADQNGQKMKRKDRRLMEKHMVKELKAARKDSAEARAKYAEYKNAKRDANNSVTYIGNSSSMAMQAALYNKATQSSVKAGKEKVNRMVADYANKYLKDISKSKVSSGKAAIDKASKK